MKSKTYRSARRLEEMAEVGPDTEAGYNFDLPSIRTSISAPGNDKERRVAGITTRMAMGVALAGLLDAGPAWAQVIPGGTYSEWTVPNQPADGFFNIDTTIFPSNEPAPGPGQVQPWLFYSSQFGIVGSGVGGYIGIQKDPNGKRAIFSIWNANGAQCAPLPGALCRPFTGEGDGYQTLVPYNWVAGRHYRTRVWVLSSDASGEWWIGEVKDETTGIAQVIGYIRVPSHWKWLDGYVVNWAEWYGPKPATCSQVPRWMVYFSPPRANGGALAAGPAYNHTRTDACPFSGITTYSLWAGHHSGTGAVPEPPPRQPGLAVDLNASTFSAGQEMTVAAALTPLGTSAPVDAYIVVRLPTGQFLSLQLGGGLVPGIVPIARGLVPFALEAALLVRYPFTGAEPRGTYMWMSVLTAPGTLNFVSPLQQKTFTVR